jgi:hypothetical protein
MEKDNRLRFASLWLPRRKDIQTVPQPEKLTALKQFVTEKDGLLANVRSGISTQTCKLFHSRKAKTAPKDFAW